MSKDTNQWILFVDESGTFPQKDQPNNIDDLAVVGLLVNRDEKQVTPHQLIERIKRAFPYPIIWPPHTWLLKQLSYPVLLYAFEKSKKKGHPNSFFLHSTRHLFAEKGVKTRQYFAERALKIWESQEETSKALKESLKILKEGKEPSKNNMKILEKALKKRDPILFEILNDSASSDFHHYAKVLKAFSYKKSSKELPPALLFASLEEERGAISQKLHQESYLTMLEMLLERVIMMLLDLGGHHDVHLRILSRYFFEANLNADIPLQTPTLWKLLTHIKKTLTFNEIVFDEMQRNYIFEREENSVHFTIDTPSKFHKTKAPEFPLVDYLAYQIRAFIREPQAKKLHIDDFHDFLERRFYNLPLSWITTGFPKGKKKSHITTGPLTRQLFHNALKENAPKQAFTTMLAHQTIAHHFFTWSKEQPLTWLK